MLLTPGRPGGQQLTGCVAANPSPSPRERGDRFHIALISPAGVALYVQFASMVGEARRVAEGWVRAKQA